MTPADLPGAHADQVFGAHLAVKQPDAGARACRTSACSAILDAPLTAENIDSPKNTRPRTMPYKPSD